MAATWRASASGGGTSGSGSRACNLLAQQNDLVVVFCCATGNTNTAPTCSDNAGGSYTLLGTAYKNSSGDTLSAFVRTSLIAANGTITVTVAPGSNTAGTIILGAIAGMSVAGAAAIRQVKLQANGAAGATPAIGLTTAGLTNNPIVGVVANATIPNIITAPSGLATDTYTGQTNPTVGINLAKSDSGFTAGTVTWGGTSPTAFAAVAVEIGYAHASVTDGPADAASAADVPGVLAQYAGAVAETASAADTVDQVGGIDVRVAWAQVLLPDARVIEAAIVETASAVDNPRGSLPGYIDIAWAQLLVPDLLPAVGAVTEAASASDVFRGGWGVSIGESWALTEARDGERDAGQSTVAENVSAQSTVGVIYRGRVSCTETCAATDAPDASVVYANQSFSRSVDEAASAAAANDATIDYAVARIESAVAQDASGVIADFVADVAEAASASEWIFIEGGIPITLLAYVNESATAAGTPAATWVGTRGPVETAAATDHPVGSLRALGAISEAVNAVATISAPMAWGAAIREAANAFGVPRLPAVHYALFYDLLTATDNTGGSSLWIDEQTGTSIWTPEYPGSTTWTRQAA